MVLDEIFKLFNWRDFNEGIIFRGVGRVWEVKKINKRWWNFSVFGNSNVFGVYL